MEVYQCRDQCVYMIMWAACDCTITQSKQNMKSDIWQKEWSLDKCFNSDECRAAFPTSACLRSVGLWGTLYQIGKGGEKVKDKCYIGYCTRYVTSTHLSCLSTRVHESGALKANFRSTRWSCPSAFGSFMSSLVCLLSRRVYQLEED